MWLESGDSLFDRFGSDWTLLQLGGKADRASKFKDVAARFGVWLTILRLECDRVREIYESDLILIRPDQIVAWRDRGSVPDCERLFARLLGYRRNEGAPRAA